MWRQSAAVHASFLKVSLSPAASSGSATPRYRSAQIFTSESLVNTFSSSSSSKCAGETGAPRPPRISAPSVPGLLALMVTWSPCAASSSSDSRSCGGPRCASVASSLCAASARRWICSWRRARPRRRIGHGRGRHVEAVRRRRLEVAEASLQVRPAPTVVHALGSPPGASGVAVSLNTPSPRARTEGRCCRARGRTTPAARACCTWCCTSTPPSSRSRAGACS